MGAWPWREWHKRAECRQQFSEEGDKKEAARIFFGPETTSGRKHENKEEIIARLKTAAEICGRCAVINECYQQLQNIELKVRDNKGGIWAGHLVFKQPRGSGTLAETAILPLEEAIQHFEEHTRKRQPQEKPDTDVA
ncbi:hypothetical protein DYH10_03530 [Candidatus Saccharibacteria bacterium CPR2]|nr:hypothetical protein [Candidatus Saccharibacteria bacterium CPR2]